MIIYLTLNTQKTKVALQEFRLDYNKQVKAHNLHMLCIYKDNAKEYERHKKPQLKYAHIFTMERLIDYYAIHCRNNKAKQLPHDRKFIITSTLMTGHRKYIQGIQDAKIDGVLPKATYFRHIERLTQVGLLVKAPRRGTSSGAEYVINPAILIPDTPPMLQKRPDLSTIIQKKSISFSRGCTGLLSFCDDTSLRSIKKSTIKQVDSGKAILESLTALRSERINYGTGGATHSEHEILTGKEGGGAPPDIVDNLSTELEYVISTSWHVLLRWLYPNRNFTEDEKLATYRRLYEYYTRDLKSKSMIYQRHNQMIMRFKLKKDNLDSHPESWLKCNPSYYLSEKNPHGFTSSKQVYLKMIEKKSIKQQSTKKVFALADCIKNYNASDNDLQIFRRCENHLSKFRDRELINHFYEAVTKPNDSKSIIKRYRDGE